MRKTLLILFFSLFLCLGCDKENDKKKQTNNNTEKITISKEEFYKAEINKALLTNLNRKTFKKNVCENIQKLYVLDNKYKMLNLIAEKLSKEANNEAFKQGIKNLKNEYKKTIKQ